MIFSSLVFLFSFLPIVFIFYYLCNDKLKNIILLLASLYFYAWGEPKYIEDLNMSVDDIIKNSDADIVMFMYNTTDFKMMIDVLKDYREKN